MTQQEIPPEYQGLTEKQLRQRARTPPALFDGLAAEFGFELDAAADAVNALCDHYLTEEQDGTKAPWQIDGKPAVTFVNPPFKDIQPWVDAAIRNKAAGTLSVVLTCASVNSIWFNHALPHCELWFFNGRVHYEPAPGIEFSTPNRDSHLMIFDPEKPGGRLGGVRSRTDGSVLWAANQPAAAPRRAPGRPLLVYVAGKFRPRDKGNSWQLETNIRAAENLALGATMCSPRIQAICPHTMQRSFQGQIPDEQALAGTMEILRRCDAMILCTNYKTSQGSLAEIEEAQRLGIPVHYDLAALYNWAEDQP